MLRRNILPISAIALAVLALFIDECRHAVQPPPAATAVSELLHVAIDDDGHETATYSVQLATQAGAIERLRDRASRLAHDSAERRLLAIELRRVKHVRAATVFTTRTPCGDTLRQAVTLRDEPAPGPLGFLKPRQTVVDIRQLTDSARTLAAQSFAVPPAAPKRWAIGASVGYGVGPDLVPRPFVGVTFSRTLIRF